MLSSHGCHLVCWPLRYIYIYIYMCENVFKTKRPYCYQSFCFKDILNTFSHIKMPRIIALNTLVGEYWWHLPHIHYIYIYNVSHINIDLSTSNVVWVNILMVTLNNSQKFSFVWCCVSNAKPYVGVGLSHCVPPRAVLFDLQKVKWIWCC